MILKVTNDIRVNSRAESKKRFRADSFYVIPAILPATFSPLICCSTVWSTKWLVNGVPVFLTQLRTYIIKMQHCVLLTIYF